MPRSRRRCRRSAGWRTSTSRTSTASDSLSLSPHRLDIPFLVQQRHAASSNGGADLAPNSVRTRSSVRASRERGAGRRRSTPCCVATVRSSRSCCWPRLLPTLAGTVPLWQAGNLVFSIPIYGGGALLIREVVRRRRRGWPSIILLGAAYGVVEEGLALQSLFSPMLYGVADWGPQLLGINLTYVEVVIPLHAVWSATVPILLTEPRSQIGARSRGSDVSDLSLRASSICSASGSSRWSADPTRS